GGLEWRNLPARTPDEPLVPSTGANGEPADETAVFSAVPGGNGGGTGNERVGDHTYDFLDDQDGQHTKRFGVLPMNGLDDEEQDGPVDLSALRADDELLTALGGSFRSSMGEPNQDPELKALLSSWRLDVDTENFPDLVDTDTAMATIAVGARIRKRKPRYLVPLASAAAVLVVVFTGMGLAARNAEPGDPLWGISQMLYSDHARSVEAAASVRSDLHHASEALEQGHFDEARSALVQAQASLPSVDNEDGKANLQAQQLNLLSQLDNTTAIPPVLATTGSSGLPTTTAPPQTTTQPTQQQTTPPDTTTDQPPPTTTPDITTNEPPPTTTDPPTAPQSGTVGNAPAQPVNDPPAQQFDPGSAGDSSSTGTGTAAGN
ncbi:MAG TPA: anti-sigma-D factor RsdA, partial [Pseudonocardiaceae bacterium]|nr:anti-sigma-D factor RsdA [Pseudonocardiaceae bacterium]